MQRPFALYHRPLRRTVIALLGLLAAIPPKVDAAAHAAEMTLPGKLDVNPTGAATYSIPIAVPPGTAGIVPSLTLEYNSQHGNGLLGVGWSLGGLPSIGRCPPTINTDGYAGTITFTRNDWLCLEGQRLINISGGYGLDGTEYRTEIEGFSKIVSYGAASGNINNGPVWFKVWTKSGQVLEFGNGGNSQVLAQGKSAVRLWMLNKATDSTGNYFSVSYTQNAAIGAVYPDQISYTGNDLAGISPYNFVKFVYAARGDGISTYQAGSYQAENKLLTNIQIYNDGTVVSDYRLSYFTGTQYAYAQLNNVQLCNGTGTGVPCLPATTFQWSGVSLQSNVPGTSVMGGAWGYLWSPIFGDWNGDGRTDLLLLGNLAGRQSYMYLADENGYQTFSGFMATDWGGAAVQTGDWDGDGKTDLVVRVNGTFYFYHSTGSSFELWGSSAWGSHYAVTIGDWDGDGRSDFMLQDQNTGYAYMYIGDGAAHFTWTGFTGTWGPWAFYTGDWNGDGRTDLLLADPATGGYWSFCLSSGTSMSCNWQQQWGGYAPTIGDFNGDGKSDVLVTIPGGATYLWLSLGNGAFTAAATVANWWSAYTLTPGDFNGDGRTDIAVISTVNGGTSSIYYSAGASFVQGPNTPAWGGYYGHAVDVNGDGAADIWLHYPTNNWAMLFTSGFAPTAVTAITDGLGATTTITYQRLTKDSNGVYAAHTTGAYPLVDMRGAMYVVSQVDAPNGGIGTGKSTTTYSYAGGKADLQGRGFLGFRQMSVADKETSITTTATYLQAYPYTGLVASQTTTYTPSGGTAVMLNDTQNTYSATSLGGSRYFPYLKQSVTASKDLDGTALPSVRTTNTYDPTDLFGNVQQVMVETGTGAGAQFAADGYSKTTTNTYTNDTSKWLLGRLTRAVVESKFPGDATGAKRTSSFAYDGTTGLLIQEVVEPDATDNKRLQTDYVYSNVGNKVSVSVSGIDIATRTSTIVYDSQGRFATKLTNALSQSERRGYDIRFGTMASRTGPNGLDATGQHDSATGPHFTTSWQYDGFGRSILEIRPDGTQVKFEYLFCSGINGGTASCPASIASAAPKYFVQATPLAAADGTTQIGPQSRIFKDILGREIRSQTQGFDGSVINVDTQYDDKGRVLKKSRPYADVGGTPQWTSYAYDTLGRPTTVTDPDNSVSSYAYHGLTTSVTNPLNQTATTVKNSQGQVIQTRDAQNHTTSFAYDRLGNLITVTDAAGNVTSYTYDLRGRKIASSDPDLGSWSYSYDALGQLVSQTDAKGQTTTLQYDKLGRVTQRAESDSNGGVLTSIWTYDTATKGIGKLASAVTSGGYQRTHGYDSLGRPSQVSLTIDGTNYTMAAAYDAYGRVQTLTYPSGFAAKYVYNATGYQSELRDNATNLLFWRADARDAEMHLVQQTFGNGVQATHGFSAQTGRLLSVQATASGGTAGSVQNLGFQYDALGNLTQRTDTIAGVTETFGYDTLNRLTSSAVSSGASKSYTYDAIGNIASKSDVGTYSYPASGVGSVRPHAVSSVSGTVSASYSYDANGNETSGAGRTLTWTAFNMPATIAQGSSTLAFSYDSEHSRIKQTAPEGTTLYMQALGLLVEKFTASGTGLVQWNEYLFANGGEMVGVRYERSDGSVYNRYFHKDHLGSIQTVTDDGGGAVERRAYDSWGKRRNLNGTDDTTGSLHSQDQTTRGYTGHEELADVGLVHMNGRVYDPLLARFTSADPFIQNAMNGQSYNRYSYVQNNPLGFTDPTGYFRIGGLLKRGFMQSVRIAMVGPLAEIPAVRRGIDNFYRHNSWAGTALVVGAAAGCSWVGASAACAAAAQAYVTGVHGGNLGDMLKSAAITYATAQAFNAVGTWTGFHNAGWGYAMNNADMFALNIAGHAAVGCASQAASGGSCQSGALSAAVGAVAGPGSYNLGFREGLVVTTVVGGVTSVVGGGKFWNGAITGAFGYLYNAVALACRSVGGSPAIHCGLFVYQGGDTSTATIERQFSLQGGHVEFDPQNSESSTFQQDRDAFRNPGGGNLIFPVAPPEGMSPQSFDQQVIRNAEGYRAGTYRMFTGPNSNSAAAYPIYRAGGAIPEVPRAPALRYWPDVDRCCSSMGR